MKLIPTEIRLLQKSRMLHVRFNEEINFDLSCEYLRVYSPSAEVRGHGLGEPKLVIGKEQVNIVGIDPVGNYAVKLIFDDGHDTGLYTWEFLYELGIEKDRNWNRYLERLQEAGYARQS